MDWATQCSTANASLHVSMIHLRQFSICEFSIIPSTNFLCSSAWELTEAVTQCLFGTLWKKKKQNVMDYTIVLELR